MKGSFKYFGALLIGIFSMACERGETTAEGSVVGENREEDLSSLLDKIDTVLMAKTAWTSHWAGILGQMSGEDFDLILSDSIDPMEMPEANPIKQGDPLFPYQFIHPDGKGTIDIYQYKVEAQEILDQPFLNPDSEVIWYRADGMKERLLFMGPSGMFEDGYWLNDDEFVVLGYFEEEQGFRPMVWLLDVKDHRLRQFRLNKGTADYLPESYLDQKLKAVDLTSNGI
ncbi:hypothetical protein [Algoriphagus confluentis]|uniref:Bifunctional isocitrate dehydrogenase kinase/phosphatase n=1 Tax=Algoriphagus confluentis TaxID=1697556 RepID=A0ABQ6PLD6_9BACT|nr:hypothetical protein Aconfl_10840 [Algoriphagus confluentis]